MKFKSILISIVILLSICCYGFASEQENIYQNGINDVIYNLSIEKVTENCVYIKYNDITHVYIYDINIDNTLQNPKLYLTLTEQSSTINTVVKQSKEIKNNVPENSGKWKSFEYYTSLTSKSSKQYKLQQYAHTDENGFRKINDCYMIATGSAYGNVGDILEVTLSSGKTFKAIKGDEKADKDTDENNQICIHDGSVIEFIVDKEMLNKTAKKLGDCSCCGFEGYVERIEAIDKYECKN